MKLKIDSPKDIGVLVKTIFKESDRGAVLLCTESLLVTTREILGNDFKTASFAQVISIIRRFSRNKEISDAAKALRTIRNKAAHSNFC